MKKAAPYLFFVASLMFYVAALGQTGTSAVWVSLGSVFLILGIINLRRQTRK